jgi:hypothetical protein
LEPDGRQVDGTGSSKGLSSFPFPGEAKQPLLAVQMSYVPDPGKERAGTVRLQTLPLDPATGEVAQGAAVNVSEVPIGGRLEAGDYLLSPTEVRYWAGMTVRYDPAQGFILGSLVAGFAGMLFTLVGRLKQGPRTRVAASGQRPGNEEKA